MGGYNFPVQIAVRDGSEGNGSMVAGFIVLKNPKTTGSIRVVRTEEGTDSTKSEMAALLEVLIGTNGWVFVEAAAAPCTNKLESKGWMINMTGVDGLIPKHLATFRVHVALSKQERLRQRTITAGSKFSGR